MGESVRCPSCCGLKFTAKVFDAEVVMKCVSCGGIAKIQILGDPEEED